MKHNHAHQINLSGLLDFHGIEEAKQIRKAVTIGCIVNILLLVIKLVFGYCGHSWTPWWQTATIPSVMLVRILSCLHL